MLFEVSCRMQLVLALLEEGRSPQHQLYQPIRKFRAWNQDVDVFEDPYLFRLENDACKPLGYDSVVEVKALATVNCMPD